MPAVHVKAKVSYYCFGKLMLLSLYLKNYIPGMNELKTSKEKSSNPIYDNSVEQQNISFLH